MGEVAVTGSDRSQMLAFWHDRAKIVTESSTRFHASHLDYDMATLSPLCSRDTRVLEIGCGRCTMLNRLVLDLGVIAHGVDVVPDFLSSAIDDPRLTTEVADAAGYRPAPGYDVIILAGLITYLPAVADRRALYSGIVDAMTLNSVLFIKSQFGKSEDVTVSGWSDAVGGEYSAFYGSIESEVALLRESFEVEVLDAYPAELSPHANTKFFHILCRPLRQ